MCNTVLILLTLKSGLCVTHILLVPPPLGGYVKVVNKIGTLLHIQSPDFNDNLYMSSEWREAQLRYV
jgi:hypothetical protein